MGQGVVIAFQVQGHGPHLEVLLVFPIRPSRRGGVIDDQPCDAFHGIEGLLGGGTELQSVAIGVQCLGRPVPLLEQASQCEVRVIAGRIQVRGLDQVFYRLVRGPLLGIKAARLNH